MSGTAGTVVRVVGESNLVRYADLTEGNAEPVVAEPLATFREAGTGSVKKVFGHDRSVDRDYPPFCELIRPRTGTYPDDAGIDRALHALDTVTLYSSANISNTETLRWNMTQELQQRDQRGDPWTDLDRRFDEMRERFFGSAGFLPFGSLFVPNEATSGALRRAALTDVSDTGGSYRLTLEIPGIPKEKLDIRVRGASVEIQGESATETPEKDAEFLYRERRYSGFYRSLELPAPVVATEATAKVENGLLVLELPKQHPSPATGEVKIAVQ